MRIWILEYIFIVFKLVDRMKEFRRRRRLKRKEGKEGLLFVLFLLIVKFYVSIDVFIYIILYYEVDIMGFYLVLRIWGFKDIKEFKVM